MDLCQLELFSPEMSKYNNYKLRPTNRDASPGQQKQRSALPTNKPKENGKFCTPFVFS